MSRHIGSGNRAQSADQCNSARKLACVTRDHKPHRHGPGKRPTDKDDRHGGRNRGADTPRAPSQRQGASARDRSRDSSPVPSRDDSGDRTQPSKAPTKKRPFGKGPFRGPKPFGSRHSPRHGGGHGGNAGGAIPAVDENGDVVRLFGLHAVTAALNNPARRVDKLYATENAERRLAEATGERFPPVTRVSPRDLDRALGADTVHQGVLLDTRALPEPDLVALVTAHRGRPLLVLDQITDPHNVGAILRSAAVFGAAGVVMTRRHSPPLNGVLAKSASGALELVPVALIGNLARALDELKDQGVRIVGLDGGAEARLETMDWSQPTAIVLGAEGKGLRELTRTTCDVLARITTDDALASLNVSNAAAIALHTTALARLSQ